MLLTWGGDWGAGACGLLYFSKLRQEQSFDKLLAVINLLFAPGGGKENTPEHSGSIPENLLPHRINLGKRKNLARDPSQQQFPH